MVVSMSRWLSRVVLAMLATVALVDGAPEAAVADPRSGDECSTTLRITSSGVRHVVRTYVGAPDDAQGTRIQDRGVLAAPIGARGGVAPGQTGNFHVDGHRNSAGGPLYDLIDVRRGDLVRVRVVCQGVSDVMYTYTVTTAKPKYVDFFTAAGRSAQIAATPFQPGVPAGRAYLTVSTCATQEDAARGDRRRDEFGNPPGRWVVVGVLVGSSMRVAGKPPISRVQSPTS